MFKVNILATALVMASAMTGLQAKAAPLTPDSIIGRYYVTAKVPFQHVELNIHVLNQKEFEIERLDRDHNPEELCNGTFVMVDHLDIMDTQIAADAQYHAFKGIFTCPSDRSKEVDFNIEFGNVTTDDLVKGTSVMVTTSLAPMKIKANVKRTN
jgi:hypothetical protein